MNKREKKKWFKEMLAALTYWRGTLTFHPITGESVVLMTSISSLQKICRDELNELGTRKTRTQTSRGATQHANIKSLPRKVPEK